MKESLQYYIECFNTLNCNKQRGEVAPHKAIMLLTVMEGVAQGWLTNCFVPDNATMEKAFKRNWERHVTTAVFQPAFATPFYHLGSEPFWTLIKTDRYEKKVEYSLTKLRECFYGAMLPEDLWQYMECETSRRQLQRALLEKYLPSHQPQEATILIAAETPLHTYGKHTYNQIKSIAA